MILFSLHTLVTKEVFPENLVTSHKSLGFQSRIQNMLWAAEDGAPEQSFSFSFLGGHSYAIKVRRGTKLHGDGDLNCLIWTRKKEWTGKKLRCWRTEGIKGSKENYCLMGTEFLFEWWKPSKNKYNRDFSGGPVIKTLCFHCRGDGFNPWSGN